MTVSAYFGSFLYTEKSCLVVQLTAQTPPLMSILNRKFLCGMSESWNGVGEGRGHRFILPIVDVECM